MTTFAYHSTWEYNSFNGLGNTVVTPGSGRQQVKQKKRQATPSNTRWQPQQCDREVSTEKTPSQSIVPAIGTWASPIKASPPKSHGRFPSNTPQNTGHPQQRGGGVRSRTSWGCTVAKPRDAQFQLKPHLVSAVRVAK